MKIKCPVCKEIHEIEDSEIENFKKETIVSNIINKIKSSNIIGRDLELYLPLFSISASISEDNFNKTLEIAQSLTKEKYIQDITEDRNIEVLVFLANFLSKVDEKSYYLQKDMAKNFKEETENEWMNSKVFGRVLRTLKVVRDKRKVAKGVEIRFDKEKIMALIKRMGIKIEETAEDFAKIDPVVSTCAYCGEKKELEFKDKLGNYMCRACYEEEQRKRDKK